MIQRLVYYDGGSVEPIGLFEEDIVNALEAYANGAPLKHSMSTAQLILPPQLISICSGRRRLVLTQAKGKKAGLLLISAAHQLFRVFIMCWRASGSSSGIISCSLLSSSPWSLLCYLHSCGVSFAQTYDRTTTTRRRVVEGIHVRNALGRRSLGD